MRLNWTQLSDRQWSAIDGPFPASIVKMPDARAWLWEIQGRAQGAGAGMLGFQIARRDVERAMDQLFQPERSK